MSLRVIVLCGFVSLAALVSGCGSGNPETFKATGKVTYNGQPVTNGVVQLMPEGGGNSAVGNLQPDGTFQLTTFEKNDGACPGTYKATVQAFPEEGDDSPLTGLPGMELNPNEKPPIPVKYADATTSDLVVKINKGENKLELELKD